MRQFSSAWHFLWMGTIKGKSSESGWEYSLGVVEATLLQSDLCLGKKHTGEWMLTSLSPQSILSAQRWWNYWIFWTWSLIYHAMLLSVKIVICLFWSALYRDFCIHMKYYILHINILNSYIQPCFREHLEILIGNSTLKSLPFILILY